jgi:hypothetical protein
LESVIADRSGRAHRFFDIARFDDALYPVGVTSPNARQKICLQLEPDRELIVLGFTHPAAQRLHPIGNPEQVLHVMPNFMGYDVGLREIASRTQAFLEYTVKTEVDVNASIFRAVEGSGRATGEPATGPDLIREKHEPGLLVLSTHLAEDLMPGVFGVGQYHSDELRWVISWPLAVNLPGLRQLDLLLGIKERLRIAAEQKIKNDENDGTNSTAHHDAPAAAGSANIFNVVAFSSSLPEHLSRIVTPLSHVYNPKICSGAVPAAISSHATRVPPQQRRSRRQSYSSIAKPIASKSAASSFAWSVVSSTRGGRILLHSGSCA